MKFKFGQRTEVIIVTVLICYFLFLIGHDLIQYLNFIRKGAELKLALNKQEETNCQLKQELQKLHTNRYLEYMARVRLGYIKAGETAYKEVKKD